MKQESFVYHENNVKESNHPQEDYFKNEDNIYVVADGITLDLVDGFYPNPSDSGNVANIICTTIVNELIDSDREIKDIKNAITKANKNVKRFNQNTRAYKIRETNGYSIGVAVFAAIIIKEGRLIYGLLDDCYFSIFSEDMVDHPTLKSYIDKSAKYYDAHYDWSKSDDRKAWRKEFRNHEITIDGEPLGYGAMDGRSGYERYVQYGEELLKPGDLICLYTDGFIKIMRDLEFIKKIKEGGFSNGTLDYISRYTKEKDISKEKTCYFIKYVG